MNDTVNLNLLISATVFKTYLTCVGILVIKMMIMCPLIGRQRIKHMAFITEEDCQMLGGRVSNSVPDVERVRRAHLNDLEGIPIFIFAAFAYMCTNPPVGTAVLLFKIFTACRIIHTIIYAVVVVPQPARVIVWIIAYFITGYMAYTAISVGMS